MFAATIREVRTAVSACRVEVLIPDLGGSEEALAVVVNAGPDVLGHNLETVPSLYSTVRPQAGYERSLQLLERARKSGNVTKSGIMVGLGETRKELSALFSDLRSVGCDILTLGQYLQPGRDHLQVKKLYHPDEFTSLKKEADAMGFRRVVSGPLVRSSYHAEQHSR